MRILVTFALENEFAPWRTTHSFRSAEWGGIPVHVAEIGGADVGVVLTGAGPKHAARVASAVVRGEGDSIAVCISSGVAGALRSDYSIGQVLAAKSVISENGRPEVANHTLPSSFALTSFAADCGAKVVDAFYSSERVIARASEKKHLAATADAVEMESFEVLFEASAAGIATIAIRAISDLADEDLPLDMTDIFTDDGQISMPRILAQAARNPQSIGGLMRLGRDSKFAAESLAKFLDRYVSMLAARMSDLEQGTAAAGQTKSEA